MNSKWIFKYPVPSRHYAPPWVTSSPISPAWWRCRAAWWLRARLPLGPWGGMEARRRRPGSNLASRTLLPWALGVLCPTDRQGALLLNMEWKNTSQNPKQSPRWLLGHEASQSEGLLESGCWDGRTSAVWCPVPEALVLAGGTGQGRSEGPQGGGCAGRKALRGLLAAQGGTASASLQVKKTAWERL